MTIDRKTSTHVYVTSLTVNRMTAGVLLAFAEELRDAGAPPAAYVTGADHGTLRCNWPVEPPSPVEPVQFVASEFVRLRKAAGLTQQDVADRVGLTRSSVANYEAGRQDVPISKLLAYADVVGASLSLSTSPPPDPS